MNSRQKGKREVWAAIPGYEGLYEVSNYGNVRSLARKTTRGKLLKPYINKYNGYATVSLSKNNRAKTLRVHKLVMITFRPIENLPKGYCKDYTIDHIDGDKTNNRLDNLEWVTQSENQLRAYALGINGKTTRKVINLDTLVVFESITEAVKSVGGKRPAMITRVCQGKRSHYRNSHFAYYEDYLNGTIPKSYSYAKRSSEMLWR